MSPLRPWEFDRDDLDAAWWYEMTEAANLFHKHLREARTSAATHGSNGRVDPTQKRLRDAQKTDPHKRTIQ